MRIARKAVVALVGGYLFFIGCVVPPSEQGQRIVEPDELSLLSAMQLGKEYARSGRADLAELKLRQAIFQKRNEFSTVDPILLNDLGFVLRSQGRLDEAEAYLEEALTLDPHSLQFRENYARVLFAKGETTHAVLQYLKMEEDYFGYWNSNPDLRLSLGFSGKDLLSMYRNLSILHSMLGESAEAICYSLKAVDLGDSSYPAAAHGKFLISIEQFFLAAEYIQGLIIAGPSEDPALLFDLGVALMLENKLPLSNEALERVVSSSVAGPEVILLSRLLMLTAARYQRDADAIKVNTEAILKSKVAVCDLPKATTPNYWPLRLVNDIEESRKEACKDRDKFSESLGIDEIIDRISPGLW